MELGNKILELRRKKGFSQEQLGEKIGVTRQTISNWELGETSPNPEQLKLLSKELDISIDELLGNDINNILINKISNTEKTSKLILKLILAIILFVIFCFCILVILRIVYKSKWESGRKIEETIYCKLYGEEHSYTINYYEETGVPKELGGDSYFADILDLDKYNNAHQIFNIINDYVKKNGGTCEMVKDKDLNDIVNIYIKEGTLTKTSAVVVIEENIDYDILYGEEFWLEKYNYKNSSYEKLTMSGNNCGFNLPAYNVTSEKPLELKQDWSCMYGELQKGLYRLVKDVFFESDIPVEESDKYYIWTEFEIE